MTLYTDLEQMASVCKHSDDPLDRYEVRVLCRRAQSVVALFDVEGVTARRVDDDGWRVTFEVVVDDIGDVWSVLADL